jgi:dolichyl-phosphate-mannose-protein mannosyltransferase
VATVLSKQAACARHGPLLVSLAIPTGFLLLGFVQARPFVDDVVLPGPGRSDDWQVYKLYAESILSGGMTIPVVAGPYVRPAGFLYNYFLAGVFRLLGDNSSHAYVVQSALLGASIALMYVTLRNFVSTSVGYVYLVVVTAYEYVDVFRNYTFRLLSENLLIALLPLLFLLLLGAQAHQSLWQALLAGLVLGLAVLTRLNLLPAALGLTAIWFGYAAWTPRKHRWLVLPSVFCLVWCGVVLLLPLRDYVVTGQLGFAAITYTGDWNLPQLPANTAPGAGPPAVALVVEPYVRNILFVLGYTPALDPQYRPRPHWVLLWAGFALALFLLWRRKGPPRFWEAAVYGFVILYLGPAVLVGYPGSYGFRTVVPALPAVLFGGCSVIDVLLARVVRQRRHS